MNGILRRFKVSWESGNDSLWIKLAGLVLVPALAVGFVLALVVGALA
jgi:hypothetical protein